MKYARQVARELGMSVDDWIASLNEVASETYTPQSIKVSDISTSSDSNLWVAEAVRPIHEVPIDEIGHSSIEPYKFKVNHDL